VRWSDFFSNYVALSHISGAISISYPQLFQSLTKRVLVGCEKIRDDLYLRGAAGAEQGGQVKSTIIFDVTKTPLSAFY
jgi:hypothetical protein